MGREVRNSQITRRVGRTQGPDPAEFLGGSERTPEAYPRPARLAATRGVNSHSGAFAGSGGGPILQAPRAPMTKRDPNDWMWERAAELLERTAWVQRRFFQVATERGSVWEPPVDVFESGEEFFVLVALPGVDPQAIEVRCDGDVLIVSARRALPPACGGAQVRRLEIPQGRFQRRIPLGLANLRVESRAVEHGVLLIRVRKGS